MRGITPCGVRGLGAFCTGIDANIVTTYTRRLWGGMEHLKVNRTHLAHATQIVSALSCWEQSWSTDLSLGFICFESKIPSGLEL
jgi:hypothetical protein